MPQPFDLFRLLDHGNRQRMLIRLVHVLLKQGMPGAGSTETPFRKALSDMPALKPYWGKPAVRNFRGGDGDVGIIRSPVRAIALLNRRAGSLLNVAGPSGCGNKMAAGLMEATEGDVPANFDLSQTCTNEFVEARELPELTAPAERQSPEG